METVPRAEPQTRRLPCEALDLVACGVGLEEGVVEDGSEVLRRGEGVSCEGCGIEVLRAVGKGIGDGQRIQKLAPSAREAFAGLLSITLR